MFYLLCRGFWTTGFNFFDYLERNVHDLFPMHFKCFPDLMDNFVFQGRFVLSNGIYLTIFLFVLLVANYSELESWIKSSLESCESNAFCFHMHFSLFNYYHFIHLISFSQTLCF